MAVYLADLTVLPMAELTAYQSAGPKADHWVYCSAAPTAHHSVYSTVAWMVDY